MTENQNSAIGKTKRLIKAIECFLARYEKFEEDIWYLIQFLELHPLIIIFSKSLHKLPQDKKEMLYSRDFLSKVINTFKIAKEKLSQGGESIASYLSKEGKELEDAFEMARFYITRHSHLDTSITTEIINKAIKLANKLESSFLCIDVVADVDLSNRIGMDRLPIEEKQLLEKIKKSDIIPMIVTTACKALTKEARQLRMTDAAILAKTIDDLGLRELAGLNEQVETESTDTGGGGAGEKEIIEIKPGWFGISIDLKEVGRRIKKKFKR